MTIQMAEAGAEERSYTGVELCALTGITYRMLDYWCRVGLLSDNADGSGSRRTFPPREVETAHAVRHLLAAGFDVRAAFTLARELVTNGTTSTTHGIYQVTVTAHYPTP